MAQLASSTEINRATFYDHFHSPGELLAEVQCDALSTDAPGFTLVIVWRHTV